MGSFHIKCIFPPLRPTCDPPRLSTHAAAQTGNLDRDPPGLSRNKSFGFYFLPRPPANQGGRINEKKNVGFGPPSRRMKIEGLSFFPVPTTSHHSGPSKQLA